MTRLRVGVIFGGRSGEHEVSLASAAAVVANLDPARYDVVPLYIGRDGRWSRPAEPPRIVSAAQTIAQAQSRIGDRSPAARVGGEDSGREVHLVCYPSAQTVIEVDAPVGRVSERGSASVADEGLGPLELARGKGLALDVLFPVLHGPYGEDGTVQGLLELAGVPYVGAGVAASAVGMDKILQKQLFLSCRIPVVPHVAVLRRDVLASPSDAARRVLGTLPLPLFVKPANLGSSVGISKAKTVEALAAALVDAAQYDRRVIVEQAVPHAREIECGVLGNDTPEASVPGEIIPSGEFYDYAAKYLSDASTLIIPATLTVDQAARVREYSLAAFRALDGAGMARVDFLMNGETGDIFLNEVNTIPGFTTISMYSKLWAASGVDYPQLLDRLIELALERHREKQALRTSAL
ncbi:MAG: D-alanine--D-alanine ligase family protein [Vicinamibacterales bacterium]